MLLKKEPIKGQRYRYVNGIYVIIESIVYNVDTKKKMVVYYEEENPSSLCARSLDTFFGEVDSDLYPNATQEYNYVPAEESNKADELTSEQQMILDFLDFKTNNEKLMFLQEHHQKITDNFLNSISIGIDFVETKDTLEDRYYDIIHYLRTLVKYEKR